MFWKKKLKHLLVRKLLNLFRQLLLFSDNLSFNTEIELSGFVVFAGPYCTWSVVAALETH